MIAPTSRCDLEVREPCPPARHQWLATLHADHGPCLRGVIRRIVGNEDETQDVYQDCLYHLARRCDHTVPDHGAAYAYRTATNLAVEAIRRRRRRSAHWPNVAAKHAARAEARSAPSATDALSARRDVSRLGYALEALPPHLREVIVLRDLNQLPYRRVGQLLGIRPATARVYRRQAVVRLAEAMAEDDTTATTRPSAA